MSLFDTQEEPYEFIKSEPSNTPAVQHFAQATFGAGETSIVCIDSEGAKFGSKILADAKAYIKTDGSFKFIDKNGNTIIDSQGTGGNFMELINSTLNTATKQILGEFTFGASGAIAIKTDADNGLWLSPTGILAKKAGVTTFALETDGDATFAGTLSAASGTIGIVTGTIQTAASGYRLRMSAAANAFQSLNGDTVLGSISTSANGDLILTGTNNVIFAPAGTAKFGMYSGSFRPITTRDYDLGDSTHLFDKCYAASYYAGSSATQGASESQSFVSRVAQSKSDGYVDNVEVMKRTIAITSGIVTSIGSEVGWSNAE